MRTPPSSGLLMSVARGLWARLRRSFTGDSATPTPSHNPRPSASLLTHPVDLPVCLCGVPHFVCVCHLHRLCHLKVLSPRRTEFTFGYAPFTCNSLALLLHLLPSFSQGSPLNPSIYLPVCLSIYCYLCVPHEHAHAQFPSAVLLKSWTLPFFDAFFRFALNITASYNMVFSAANSCTTQGYFLPSRLSRSRFTPFTSLLQVWPLIVSLPSPALYQG